MKKGNTVKEKGKGKEWERGGVREPADRSGGTERPELVGLLGKKMGRREMGPLCIDVHVDVYRTADWDNPRERTRSEHTGQAEHIDPCSARRSSTHPLDLVDPATAHISPCHDLNVNTS
jgi:hypothetical protein